ncbi:thioesterase II family protein [Streptomyces sp. NBC_00503]|uniref:thioesterase II family protein n=1 Tax=Streptomyces sp. NBC_00503 TaxID=2903659 RepID=UPI002E81B601|nr:alpha/beta fold hydrolase [Streptomyces sp. NBC_00503]WUD86365.1 alpha/beta fold hydrolase [Streptomyces sp. NBC_00503]
MNGPSGDPEWFRVFSPAPDASVRLICLPHAGGSASFYFPVAKALSPAVEVLAVQYPGRQDRRLEPLVEDIHTLADRITGALSAYRDKPLALFGHSMGAIIGFEIAQRLEEQGDGPVELFASGRRAPSTSRGERWHAVGDAELVAEIKSHRAAGSELLDDPEMRALLLPTIRADYKAVETYVHRPGATVHCPVTAFTGDRDPKVTVEEALAWRRHTTGAFHSEVFTGGHFYLSDHQDAVLRTVSARLAAGAATAV